MIRREFIALLGGAAAWPMAARAQQPAVPVIGWLYAGSASSFSGNRTTGAFRVGFAEGGFTEGQNVTIEYRFGEGHYDRLPALAADLIRRQVSLIIATPNHNTAYAAKEATATIPILFMVSDDPAKLGLVASLNRPGGNATGVNYFLSELVGKRVQLLHELVPAAKRFGVLINPSAASAEGYEREAKTTASAIGMQADFVQARDANEIDSAFATLAANKIPALLVLPDTFFVNRRVQIATLATRHAIPAIYTVREYVEVGGLISYGPNLAEPNHQLGVYAARILKGAKPANLPVVQATKIELVINQPTARALGLEIAPTLLARADEVIE
jgi:putative ABC transport system substrate-binding protein